MTVWGNSIVAFIVAILTGAGFSAIIYGVYHFWAKSNKKQIQDSEAVTIIAVLFFVGLAGAMFLINQLAEDSKKVYNSEQTLNCWNTTTADGKALTESQCEYFQDVLDGKYTYK